MRYIIELSYDGSAFCGWQVQPSVPTVQGLIEESLGRLLRAERVPVTGAGRTDTGVNAVGYRAHFDWEGPLPCTCAELTYKLSAILPDQIVVHSVREASGEDFHARFSATGRTYKYFIHFNKNPFVQRYSWYCHYPLDIDAMNEACACLLGTHDFSCFEKKGGNNATSICTVTEARWEYYTPGCIDILGYPADDKYLVFTISADRFLRNMVRATVGSMVEVGRGRRAPGWIAELMESGTRSDAGESVIGEALFLTEVRY
ncbi:MAG: tRNA pseudouridine(38-40) synthase TruA [Bacteroidales bacterium]|nr:tRNA pseudouridine(38-40) synthase TruA [Bacteroidales bacterium]